MRKELTKEDTMCCPICETGTLFVSIPALHDQEPVMTCAHCGQVLDARVTELYALPEPETVKELKQAA